MRKSYRFWINLLLVSALLIVWSIRSTYVWILHKLSPDLFSQDLALWVERVHVLNHATFLLGSFAVIVLIILGFRKFKAVQRLERAFRKTGIKNSQGEYPKVLDLSFLSSYRSRATIMSDGISPLEYEKKTRSLQTSIKGFIESIKETNDPQILEIYSTTRRLPTRVLYGDVVSNLSSPYQFVVGETSGEVITQSITDLPHMLVAGATNMGKSYFLRQLVLSILENNTNTQIYTIDLKRGTAMRDFTVCPNVRMFHTVSDAILALRTIKKEMHERFKLLESCGDEEIEPKKHKRDRIIIVIDEASMLYSSLKTRPGDKLIAKEAIELTEEIAKLSRAAAINLILGTQKVTKETIHTHIQENIEGRVCFKVNSFQGSAVVLGDGSAKDLPHIKGRAIWRFGAKTTELQTPLIEKEELKKRCGVIKDEFARGERKLFQPMMDESQSALTNSKDFDKESKLKETHGRV